MKWINLEDVCQQDQYDVVYTLLEQLLSQDDTSQYVLLNADGGMLVSEDLAELIEVRNYAEIVTFCLQSTSYVPVPKDEDAKISRKLAPFTDYISRRVAEGESNARQLFRELSQRGYTGGYTILKEYVRPLRVDTLEEITVVPSVELSTGARMLFRQLTAEKELSLDELSDRIDCSPRKTREYLTELETHGYDILKRPQAISINRTVLERPTTVRPSWDGELYTFGVVSDLHIGNEHCLLSSLKTAYEWFDANNCQFVVNCGDLFDGSPNMHPGMWADLCLTRLEDQMEFAYQHYPTNLPTFFIDGNHDLSWKKSSGYYPTKGLCLRRPEWHYLGAGSGYLAGPHGNEQFIYVSHPNDAGSRDPSAKNRRIAEWLSYQPADEHVQLTITGHYHKFDVTQGPHGSFLVMVPASCGMTAFQSGRNLHNHIGAVIIQFRLTNDGKFSEFSHRFLPFTDAKEVDYEALLPTTPLISIGNPWRNK